MVRYEAYKRLGIVVLALQVGSSGTAPAEEWKAQYNKLRQEFKDYIETTRRNEEIKRQELKIDSAKKLLIVADSLSRITAVYNPISCDIVKSYSENLKKNIDVIYGQLLSASGLTPIEPAAGDKFDDRMHNAIGLEYGTTYPENSVFRVIRKGYRIENTVVRPAEVIISKRPVEVIKITRRGLRDRILRWISPAKLRFAEVNQRIAEFERLQRGNIEKHTEDIASLKGMITQLEECMQEEKIERLTQDISSLRSMVIELEEKIALKEQTPLQSGYQENEVIKNNQQLLKYEGDG